MSPLGDRLVAGRGGHQSLFDMVTEGETDQSRARSSSVGQSSNADLTQREEGCSFSDEKTCQANEETPQIPSDVELEQDALLQSTPTPEKRSDQIVPGVDEVYRSLKSVVENLRNHPSNSAFRNPMPLDFQSFAQSTGSGEPVDFYVMLAKVANRQYGHIGDRLTPFERLKADLKRLWTLARSFYGSNSPQGRCASVLERFAEVVVAEWDARPKSASKAHLSAQAAQRNPLSSTASYNSGDARWKAAAMMSSWSAGSKGSLAARSGKRSAPSDSDDPKSRRVHSNVTRSEKARPAKQRRSALGTDRPVDMGAFHRAMMGDDRPTVSIPAPVEVDDVAMDSPSNEQEVQDQAEDCAQVADQGAVPQEAAHTTAFHQSQEMQELKELSADSSAAAMPPVRTNALPEIAAAAPAPQSLRRSERRRTSIKADEPMPMMMPPVTPKTAVASVAAQSAETAESEESFSSPATIQGAPSGIAYQRTPRRFGGVLTAAAVAASTFISSATAALSGH